MKPPPNVTFMSCGGGGGGAGASLCAARSEEHTSELQSRQYLHSFPTRRSSDLFNFVMTHSGHEAPAERHIHVMRRRRRWCRSVALRRREGTQPNQRQAEQQPVTGPGKNHRFHSAHGFYPRFRFNWVVAINSVHNPDRPYHSVVADNDIGNPHLSILLAARGCHSRTRKFHSHDLGIAGAAQRVAEHQRNIVCVCVRDGLRWLSHIWTRLARRWNAPCWGPINVVSRHRAYLRVRPKLRVVGNDAWH